MTTEEEEREEELARGEERLTFDRVVEAMEQGNVQGGLINLFDEVSRRYGTISNQIKWKSQNSWISPIHYDDGWRSCNIKAKLVGVTDKHAEIEVEFFYSAAERCGVSVYLEASVEETNPVEEKVEWAVTHSSNYLQHQLIYHYGNYPVGEIIPPEKVFTGERFAEHIKEMRRWIFKKIDNIVDGVVAPYSTTRRYDWRIR